MKSRYVCTWSANVGDINRNKLRFGYEISDSGKYSGFGYPDIRVPVEITSVNVSSMYNFIDNIPPLLLAVTALTKKNTIASLLKFAGYIHNHKILPGNIFGLILKNKMAARDIYST